VHDLDPIAFVENRIAPLASTHHDAIELNRDSRGRKIELGD
jgi:hypothetical protein